MWPWYQVKWPLVGIKNIFLSHLVWFNCLYRTKWVGVKQLGIWPNQKGNSQIVPYRELIKKAAIISLHEIKRAPQYLIYNIGYIKKATSNQKGTSIFLEKSKGHIQFPDWIQLNKIEKKVYFGLLIPKMQKHFLGKITNCALLTDS